MIKQPARWPLLLVALLLGAATASAAAAQVWNEAGDAGDLPATAQVPLGSGALTAIIGTLSAGGDADLYLIRIDDPATFEASTCSSDPDTQLWLFARDGNGITFDDDDPDCGVLSTITPANVTVAGSYYLGVSAYDWDALDAQGREIWLDAPYDEERAPDGPGAPGPLAAWGGVAYEEGSYEISLAGVSWPQIGISEVPAPAAVFVLHGNTPNPFNPATTISYEVPVSAAVDLRVYDATGRLVRVLAAGFQTGPAAYRVIWDGRDGAGRRAASGTYFYRLEAGSFSAARAMVLIR